MDIFSKLTPSRAPHLTPSKVLSSKDILQTNFISELLWSSLDAKDFLSFEKLITKFKFKIDLNSLIRNGQNLLHCACSSFLIDYIQYLLELKTEIGLPIFDVNGRDFNEISPIHYILKSPENELKIECLKILITFKLNLNLELSFNSPRHNYIATPIMLAVYFQNYNIAILLLSQNLININYLDIENGYSLLLILVINILEKHEIKSNNLDEELNVPCFLFFKILIYKENFDINVNCSGYQDAFQNIIQYCVNFRNSNLENEIPIENKILCLILLFSSPNFKPSNLENLINFPILEFTHYVLDNYSKLISFELNVNLNYLFIITNIILNEVEQKIKMTVSSHLQLSKKKSDAENANNYLLNHMHFFDVFKNIEYKFDFININDFLILNDVLYKNFIEIFKEKFSFSTDFVLEKLNHNEEILDERFLIKNLNELDWLFSSEQISVGNENQEININIINNIYNCNVGFELDLISSVLVLRVQNEMYFLDIYPINIILFQLSKFIALDLIRVQLNKMSKIQFSTFLKDKVFLIQEEGSFLIPNLT